MTPSAESSIDTPHESSDAQSVTITVGLPSHVRVVVAERLEDDEAPREELPSDVAHPIRPQLVLLPGMLGDASLWSDVVPALMDIAAVRTARIDLERSISALAELVLAEAPPRFALAGHSLGAIVALEIVRAAPNRVTRLALINSSGRAPSEVQRSNWTRLRERIERGEFDQVAEELSVTTLPETRSAEKDLVLSSRRMAFSVGEEGFLRQLEAQQSRSDYLGWLPTVAIPTAVVSGELDDVCPMELQQELVAAIPDAVHHVLPRTGHMSPVESPRELGAILRAWLID